MDSETKFSCVIGLMIFSLIILLGFLLTNTHNREIKDKSAAFALGQEARIAGVTDCANPYQYTYLRKQWLRGWMNHDK